MNKYMRIADILYDFDKQIEQLEKENAELKEKLEYRNCVDCSNHGSNIKLIKAKKIMKIAIEGIKHWGMVCGKERPYEKLAELEFNLFLEKAEQFIKN